MKINNNLSEIKNMNEKDLAIHIYSFIKINPKRYGYPKITKPNATVFNFVQSIFQEQHDSINHLSYNDIFYSKTGNMLGKTWINLLLSANNIAEYNEFRKQYPFCNQTKLKSCISFDLFNWFYNSKQKAIIDAIEIDLDMSIKKQLIQIRDFLLQHDWSNFFWNLQKLMHSQIVEFLSWENNILNFVAYSKVLKKKLRLSITESEVEKYLEIIEKINLYRNTLAKVNAGSTIFNQQLFNFWNDLSNLDRMSICFSLYFQLMQFITLTNIINYKSHVLK